MSTNTGYQRKLGSKREQRIITPPAPRRKGCGCWYRGDQLWQMCVSHAYAVQKVMEEEQKKQTPPAAPPATPWVEKVEATEAIQVGIVTPES